MKNRSLSPLLALLLLSTPLTSQAHDSLVAMQQGGSLMKLTAAFLHPFLETPYWPILLLATLALMILRGSVKRWRKSTGHAHATYGMQAQLVRVAHRRNPK